MCSKFGIGLVGCGTIGGVHAKAIRQLENAELVSVYSRSLDNAKRLGKEFDTAAGDDWQSFIEDKRLELVSICTPSGTHLDYGKLAAEAGKHVVVEKPIEVTLARGRELIKACRENGVGLAVIFQNRFTDAVMKMKETIQRGELGPIFLADAYVKWFRKQAYYDSAAWRGTLDLDGGGVLINQAIHTIDLLQYLVGPVATVYGQTGTFTHRDIEGEDTAVACLRFQNGAVGVLEASTSVQPGQARRLEIHGSEGTAVLDGDSFTLRTGESDPWDSESKQDSGAVDPLQGFSAEPHRRQFAAIIESLRRGEQPPISGKDSLASLAIVRAVYESARCCAPIKLRALIENSH